MNLDTELVPVYCPYCGEHIQLLVDPSIEAEEYIEDCSVCCRPITVFTSAAAAGLEIRVQREDD